MHIHSTKDMINMKTYGYSTYKFAIDIITLKFKLIIYLIQRIICLEEFLKMLISSLKFIAIICYFLKKSLFSESYSKSFCLNYLLLTTLMQLQGHKIFLHFNWQKQSGRICLSCRTFKYLRNI
jgi:hypothetical protein